VSCVSISSHKYAPLLPNNANLLLDAHLYREMPHLPNNTNLFLDAHLYRGLPHLRNNTNLFLDAHLYRGLPHLCNGAAPVVTRVKVIDSNRHGIVGQQQDVSNHLVHRHHALVLVHLQGLEFRV
jgi:hypothetical protein